VINCVRPAGGPDVSGARWRVLVVVVVVVCGTTLRSLGIDLEVALSALAAFGAMGMALAREVVARPEGEAA
jgi:hypothetical protein